MENSTATGATTTRQLFAHQKTALNYAKDRSRIALFMEMRLGKSLVVIHWARLRKLRRILVLAPVTVLNTWWDELDLEGEKVWWMNGLTAAQKEGVASVMLGTRTWYLLNYQGLTSAPGILDFPWDGIICDESTAIRNPQANITKLLINRGRAEHRALLTGLPNPENTLDYFTQFQFAFGSFCGFHNYWAYRNKKFTTRFTDWDWAPKTGVRAEIKTELQDRAFIMSRKKAGVGNQKLYTRRTIAPPADVRRMIKHADKYFEFKDTVTNYAVVKVTWMARLAGGFRPDTLEMVSSHKMDELKRIAFDELPKEPLVVWFRFNEELNTAVRLLGAQADGLTGDDSAEERRRLVQRFQSGKLRIICVQGKLGMYSLNLSRSSTAIYYSNHYDQEVRAQSEDRIEHLTKKRPLLYIDLETEDSPDGDVIKALKEKKITSNQLNDQLADTWATKYRKAHNLELPWADGPLKSSAPSTTKSFSRTSQRVFPGDM